MKRLISLLAALACLLGAFVAPSAHAAATYDITQVGDVGFSQVWNATGNKEVKSGDTIGFNPWSVRITLEGHIDDISALAAGDVVSVPLTSDAGSHFSMNGTGWECADDVATSDGTVAFKANMRDGRADLRLTRTAARLSGRFDFRVVIRNGNLWYADQKSTSSTWHAGSDTFAFHNTTKPNHRCVNDTTGVGVNSTKSGVNASMVTWNCATVNRIARGGAESDTAPDVTYHIHIASADEAHPVTVASNTRVFESYYAYDGTTAGDAFTGPGGGSHVAYVPKRTDGTPTAGEYRLVANADGSYDYDLDIGPREGTGARRFAKPAVDATTAELMEASNMLFQVDYGGININFDSSTKKRSAVVTWTSSERAGGSFLASNTITTNTGRSRALIAYDGNGAGSGGVAPTVGDPGTTAKAAANGFTRTGHAFTGWNTRRDGTGVAYQAGAGIAYPAEGQTLTLYAQWEANAYKTEFRDWRGRTITSATARYGTTPTVPALADTTWLADPDMNFDNVDGWRDDWWHGSPTFTKDGLTVNSRDTRANGKTVGANAAIHVEADADYSEANATNAAKSSGIGFNINNESGLYRGWNVCPNGRQCEVDAVLTAGLASSQTIEPWVQIANDQFNGYGTATVHHMQLTQVDPATHNGVARDGYVFTGWDKDPSKPVEGDTVYTARYRPAVYKVRFDANGGTGAMADQSHTYDRKQALTANTFAREGYRFTGWNTRGDGKGKAFTDKQTVTNLLTHDGATGVLYAQWERLPETALPWSGGTMTHNLTTILGGASYPRHPIRPHAPAQAGLSHARRVM